MKNVMTILGAIIIASSILTSCTQTSDKQKELDLKEKELALKEKELALKEKESESLKTATNDNTAKSVTSDNNSDLKIVGTWRKCESNSNFEITIKKQDAIFMLILPSIEVVLEKKAEGIYTAGQITIRYINSSNHLAMSGYGDGYGNSKFELCKSK
jgi:hypothetical protein